jgi:uncharacterized protein YutE (UPF0331/DUF86 family)
MEDEYRFENLTPDQVNRAKGLYQSYGMSSLPLNRGAEAFNALPVDQRKRLFDVLQNSPEATPEAPPSQERPVITEVKIGERVFSFGDQAPRKEPSITDLLAQRGIQSRDASFSDTIDPKTGEVIPGFKPSSQIVTVENLLERGYQVRDAMPEAPYGEAAKQGLRRGLLEGGVTGLGIAGGIRAGVALMPYVASVAPAAAPFTPLAGGLAGFAASLFAADEAEEALDTEELRPKDPRVQPLYEGMRTFGGFLGGGVTAYSLPTATAQSGKIGKLLGEMGDFARANPHTYMAREAVISAYAGLYGGSIVALLPPEQYPVAGPLTRLVAEMGAGILSPGKIAFDAFMVGRSGMSVKNERKAAEAIRRVLEGEGEDIKKVADELATAMADRPIDPKTGLPVALTSAQLIDSRGLTMLERTLARNNAAFSAETKEIGEQGLSLYNELLRRLKDSGDPNLVAKAVRMEEAHMQRNLQMAIDQATFIAADKAAKLGLRSVKDRAQIALILEAELQKIVDASRQTQLELYTDSIANAFRVTKKGRVVPVKVAGTNLTQQYLELMSGYDRPTKGTLEADYGFVTSELRRLGLDVKEAKRAYTAGTKTSDYMDFFRNKRQGTSPALAEVDIPEMRADRLIQLISDFRTRARDFRGQGKAELAKNYTMLANAALEDLNKLDDPVYAEARAFTKAFHDVFSRTFAGELDDVDTTGRLRIPVETMVSRTVRGGADAAYMRMKEITDAARFSEKLLADRQSVGVVNEAYAREARAIKESLTGVKDINPNDTRQVTNIVFTPQERARGAKAVSLSEFIKRTGGIADVGGELSAQDITNRTLPGLVRRVQNVGGRIIVPPDAGMDAVRQRVFDAGYFPGKTNYNQITDDEIISALRQDLFGNKVWTVAVQEKLAPIMGQREAIDDWASQGITADMEVDDIAEALLRSDEVARKQGRPTTVPDSLLDKVALERRPAGGIDPDQIVNTVLGAQQRMLRSLAAETTEIRDGQRLINPKKFQSFIERNNDLIQELGLQQEFSDILRAQQALDDVLDPASKANYTLRGQKILADLLDNENPFDPVFNAISGNTPVRDMKELLRTIYTSPMTAAEKAQAREGLKSILLDYAYQKAGGAENFKPSKYERALFGPLGESDRRVFPSLMSLMRQEGIITPEEFRNHKRMLDAQLNIERTMAPGGKLVSEEMMPSAAMSTLEELYMTQIMARIAGAANPGGPGSLSFAQRLIRRGERLFKQMPTQKQMAMLREAAKDPVLMEQLLRKDLTMQEKRSLARRLVALVLSPGITSTSLQRYITAPSEEELAREQQEERARKAASRSSAVQDLQALPSNQTTDRLPRSRPPAPTTRGVPGLTPPAGGAPPAGGGGGAPPTSQSRMMLQQLFPNDAIMGAAAVQAGMPPMPG